MKASSLPNDTQAAPAAGSPDRRLAAGRRLARRPPDGRPPEGGRGHAAKSLPYLLVTPLAVFIVGLALVPAAFTIVQSFYRVNALDPPTRFDGLGNFRRLFANNAVLTSMGNTAVYVVVGVALSTVLGIAMAVVLRRPFRGRGLLIAVLILPWALPGVVEGILWTGICDPNSGLLNGVLSSLHLSSHGSVLLGHNRLLTIVLIELVQVWQITPLSALLVLAALQLIPQRPVRGRRDRRLRRMAGVLAHHAATGPAGHRGRHGAGADRHAQRLRPAVRAQRGRRRPARR